MRDMPEREVFSGFHKPAYTQVPDEIFDEIAPLLRGPELRVLLYIVRHTFGWKKDSDRISLSQFTSGIVKRDGTVVDRGCGAGRSAIKEALRTLEADGYIEREQVCSKDMGHEPTTYRLRMASGWPQDEPEGRFTGFQDLNYTPTPDELFDRLLPDLTDGELRVLLYIVRRTFGFKVKSADISLSRMLHGTRDRDGNPLDRGAGVSKPTLLKAISGLKAKHVIIADQRRSAERGFEPTIYRLNIITDPLGKVGGRALVNEPTKLTVSHEQTDMKPISPGDGKTDGQGMVNSTARARQARGQGSARRTAKEHGKADGHTNIQNNKRQNQETEQQQIDKPTIANVVVALVSRGVTQKTAEALTHLYPAEKILAQIHMLDHRDAHNPPAMLVKAIQEDWAPPPGYEQNTEPEEVSLPPKSAEPARETPEAWRARQLATHGIDEATEALWAEVCRWAPRLAGKRECPDWLRDAVMPLPRSGFAEVLLREIMYRQIAEREYAHAVEAALATVLGREVRVGFRYAP